MLTEVNLKEAFNRFDLDGDGYIQLKDLKTILGSESDDDEQLDSLIGKIDSNGTGKINYEEFKKIMQIFCKRNSLLSSPAYKRTSDPFRINIILQARKLSKLV